MPADMEAAYFDPQGQRERWGTSSRAVQTGRAMMDLAGGLPHGWERVAAAKKAKGGRAL